MNLRNAWTLFGLFSGLALAFAQPSPAQDDTAAEPDGKALKYHQVLRKRPAPGYLFDRFYNAWLDNGSINSLEQFLREKSTGEGTSADQLLLAYFHSHQGESAEAIAQFRVALETDPRQPDAWFQLAKEEERTLQLDSAIASLRQALDVDPKPDLAKEIRQAEGRLTARNGEREKAVEIWNQLLTDYPDDEELREDMIDLQFSEGLYEEAARTAEALAKSTKDPYQAVLRQLNLGEIYLQFGDHIKGIKTLTACLNKVGGGSWIEKEVYAQIEKTFRSEDNLVGLGKYYARLLEEKNTSVTLLRHYSELLAELGEGEAAIASFKDLLAITPGDQPLREAFIDLLESLGKTQLALEQLETLAKHKPDDAEIILRKAGLLFDDGQPDECAAVIAEFVERSDGSEANHLRGCRLLDQYGLDEAADEAYIAAVAAFPDSPVTLEAHAVYLFKTGNKQEAIAIWRKLAAGGDQVRVQQVARALSSRGEHKHAFTILRTRLDEFDGESTFLVQLCELAQALKLPSDALPWARKLVDLAGDSESDLETAIKLTSRIARSSDSSDQLIVELQHQAQERTAHETCLLAALLESQGGSLQATEVLESITESHPRLAMSQLARLYERRRNWDKATELIEKIIDLPGGRKPSNLRKIVQLAQRQGDPDLAMAWIPEWKKVSPSTILPWTTEARLHLELRDVEKAIRTLRLALQQFDGNVDLRARLAGAYAESHQFAEAQRIYQRLYDESTEVANKLQWVSKIAKVAEERDETKELIQRFESRRNRNRGSIVPLLSLAEIHRVFENSKLRREALHEAARIKPDHLDLLFEIAKLEERDGDIEAALATLGRAAAVDKTNATRERITQLHFKNGDKSAAFQVIAQMAKSAKLDARKIERLVLPLARNRDWPTLVETLKPFATEVQNDYRLRYLRAVALEEDNDFDAALAEYFELLRPFEEIPNLGPPHQDIQSAIQNLQSLRGILPDEVADLLIFAETNELTGNHKNDNGIPPVLPTDLRTLRHFALTHTLQITSGGSDKEITESYAKLGRLGIKNLEFYTDFSTSSANAYALIEQESPGATAIALILVFNKFQDPVELRHCLSGFELFEESHPELALVCALKASATSTPEAKELVERGLRLAQGIENPARMVVNFVVTAISGTDTGKVELHLTSDQRGALSERLVEWYPSYKDFPGVFARVSSAITNPSLIFKLLDRRVDEPPAVLQQPTLTVFALMGNQLPLYPFEFPPSHLPGVSGDVLAVFNPPSTLALPESLAGVDAPESPMLRILYYDFIGGHKKDIEREIESIATAESPPAAELILSAAYLESIDKSKQALDLLRRARSHRLSAETSKMVDMSTAIWSNGLPDSELAEQYLDEARAAAMRLRRFADTTDRQLQLVALLNKFGLEDQAAALADAPSSANSQLIVPTRFTPSIRRRSFQVHSLNPSPALSPAPLSGIEKLLEKGNTRQAERAVVFDLRVGSRALLRPSAVKSLHAGSLAMYTGDGARQNPAIEELLTGAIAALEPSADASSLRWAEFAAAHEIIGDQDEAKTIYRSILERDPDHAPSLMRLFSSIALTHQEEAIEVLLRLEPHYFKGASERLAEWFSEDPVKLAEFIAQLLPRLESPERYDLSWISKLAAEVQDPVIPSMPSTFSLTALHDLDEVPEIGIVHEEAEPAKKILRTAMLDVPQLALRGYYCLLPEATEAEAEQSAMRALLVGSDLKKHPTNWRPDVGLSPPERFIARAAWKAGDADTIENETIPKLEEVGRTSAIENLRLLSALYFCESDEFSKAISDFQISRPSGYSYAGVNVADTVVDIWRERGATSDIRDFLLGQLQGASQRSITAVDLAPHIEYMRSLSATGGFAAVQSYVLGATAVLIGDDERQQKRLDDLAELLASKTSGHDFGKGMAALCRFYEEMRNSPPLCLNAIHLYQGTLQPFYEYSGKSSDTHRKLAFSLDETTPVSIFRQLISGAPFFCEFADFLPLHLSVEPAGSAFGSITLALTNLPPNERKQILDEVKKMPQSFGRDLFLASSNLNPGSGYEFLVPRADEIRALTEEDQQNFAVLSYAWAGEEPLHTEDSRKIRDYFVEIRPGGARDRRRKFMLQHSVDPGFEIGVEVVDLIGPLLSDRHAEAHALFDKAIALWTADNPRPHPTESLAGGSEPGRWLDLTLRRYLSPDALAFVLEAITRTDRQAVELQDPQLLEQQFLHFTNPAGGVINSQQLLKSIVGLEPYFTEAKSLPLLVGAISRLCSDALPADVESAVAGLRELAASAEDPSIFREFVSAASLSTATPDTERYLSYLQDESVSVTARTAAYALVAAQLGEKTPEPHTRAAAELVLEYEFGGMFKPIPFYISAVFMERFHLIGGRDDAWHRTAESLLSDWRPLQSGGTVPVTANLLAIALETGDIDNASRIVSCSKRDAVQPDGSWALLLTKHKQFELARKLFLLRWKYFDFPEPIAFDYDDEFPANVRELIPKIRDADVRFFAQLMLAECLDDRLPPDQAEKECTERIVAVARRFPDAEINYKPTRRRLLSLISRWEEAADAIPESYAAITNGYDMESYVADIDANDLDNYLKTPPRLYLTHLRQSISKGGAAAVTRSLDALEASVPEPNLKDEHRFGLASAIGPCIHAIQRGVAAGWTSYPEEDLRAIALRWRETRDRYPDLLLLRLAPTGSEADGDYQNFDTSGFDAFIHLISGEAGQTDPNPSLDQLEPCLEYLGEAFSIADAERRIDLVEEFLKTKPFPGIKPDRLRMRLIENGLLDAAEALQYQERLGLSPPPEE